MAALGVGCFVAAGCNEKALESSRRSGDAGADMPGGLTPEQAARVLAKVGDRTITLGDYAATLERMDSFDRLRYQAPEKKVELLEEIIDVELLAQEARSKGLDQQPETKDAVRQIMRDALLRDAKSKLPPPADIPIDEVRAYYDAHRSEFREPERRRVSHIVVKDKETAMRILPEARKANLREWGELFTKYSIDAPKKPSASQPVEMAGDLGLVGAPGEARGDNPRIPEELRKAVFELAQVNDVYDKPVEAMSTWHIVRFAAKTDAHDRSMSEADRAIRVKILEAKIEQVEKDLEAELRRQFEVKIDETALANVAAPSIVQAGADAGTGR